MQICLVTDYYNKFLEAFHILRLNKSVGRVAVCVDSIQPWTCGAKERQSEVYCEVLHLRRVSSLRASSKVQSDAFVSALRKYSSNFYIFYFSPHCQTLYVKSLVLREHTANS